MFVATCGDWRQGWTMQIQRIEGPQGSLAKSPIRPHVQMALKIVFKYPRTLARIKSLVELRHHVIFADQKYFLSYIA